MYARPTPAVLTTTAQLDIKRSELEFRRFWQRLQAMGLNAYEARSYLVLVGHPRFKALELAARAHVPRQKIYEVLDGLVEKGFAQVVQERTKLFSAVPPDLAVPSYLARERALEDERTELSDQSRSGNALVEESDVLLCAGAGRARHPRLPAHRQRSHAGRRAIPQACWAVRSASTWSFPVRRTRPIRWMRRKCWRRAAVACTAGCWWSRVRSTPRTSDFSPTTPRRASETRQIGKVPMKMAVMDKRHGLLALVDPVITKPAWTSLVFEHEGMAEAMSSLFEDYWRRASHLPLPRTCPGFR